MPRMPQADAWWTVQKEATRCKRPRCVAINTDTYGVNAGAVPGAAEAADGARAQAAAAHLGAQVAGLQRLALRYAAAAQRRDQ